jgi:hypothetical protein
MAAAGGITVTRARRAATPARRARNPQSTLEAQGIMVGLKSSRNRQHHQHRQHL